MRIDSHHHFWKYSAAEYGWMSDAQAAIRRDFGPEDLKREIDAAGIDGVVSYVQARQSPEENDALLDHAAQHDFIKGVVGWAPLVDPGVGAELEKLAKQPKLKGVRHVLHDEADDNYMLREDFNRGLALLKDLDLVYDILIFEKHLPQTQLVDRHPDQGLRARPHRQAAHQGQRARAVAEPHRRAGAPAQCLLQGLRHGDRSRLRRLDARAAQAVFRYRSVCFRAKRLMFGSDWPVCIVAVEYIRWAKLVREWVSDLPADDQERILGGTAVEAYRL